MQRVPLFLAVTVFMLATATTLPAAAQQHDPDRAIQGGGELVEGWMGRTDRGQDFSNVRFTRRDSGFEVNVGPALILYRPEHTASGSFTVRATFTQTSSKGHAHGAGLIFGGENLQEEGQVYTYFMVRGDGAYLVKTRTGDETAYLTQWTMHDAVTKESDEGRATNELSVEVGPQTTVFKVNGTEVYRHASSGLYTDGVYGIRLNHNLDMLIDGLEASRGT